MDFDTYRRAYFVNPPPHQRFRFVGSFGVTMYFEEYHSAIAFYERILGPPSYVEGDGTRGWPIGNGWLTLLKGKKGNPQNIEITFELESVEEAEALQRDFIAAGARGQAPSDQLPTCRQCWLPWMQPFMQPVQVESGPYQPGTSSLASWRQPSKRVRSSPPSLCRHPQRAPVLPIPSWPIQPRATRWSDLQSRSLWRTASAQKQAWR